jgi:pantothenate kinase
MNGILEEWRSMREWAKILRVDETQILYFVEYDTEHEKDEMAILHQMIQDDDVNFDMKLRNVSVETAFKLYDSMDENAARKLIGIYENTVRDY